MEPHVALETTTADLRRVMSAAKRVLVVRPEPAMLRELSALRAQMIDGLVRYQRCVHRCFDAALLADDTITLATAIDAKIGAIALGRSYAAFTERWVHRDVLANWPEYRLSANRMMNAIQAALDEGAGLVGGVGPVQPRPRPAIAAVAA